MKKINYHVVRSKKRTKTLMLKIERDGSVVMHVPYHTSEPDIQQFFQAKLPWVEKKLGEKERILGATNKPIRFVPGEKFLYLGQRYPLEYRESKGRRAHLALSHGVFYLDEACAGQGRELFISWYKERAREIFDERVRHYSKQLRLFPKEVGVTSAKSRYGSCSPENKLSFSFRLVMAPYPMIDYVIVHELAHIKIKNHSRRFWMYMEEAMPEYGRYKKWLKENSLLLDI